MPKLASLLPRRAHAQLHASLGGGHVHSTELLGHGDLLREEEHRWRSQTWDPWRRQHWEPHPPIVGSGWLQHTHIARRLPGEWRQVAQRGKAVLHTQLLNLSPPLGDVRAEIGKRTTQRNAFTPPCAQGACVGHEDQCQ